jgi:hypothetical protein
VTWTARAAPGRPRIRRRTAAAATGVPPRPWSLGPFGRVVGAGIGVAALLLSVPSAPSAAQEPAPGADVGSPPENPDEPGGSVRLTVTDLSGVLGPGSRPHTDDGLSLTSEAPEQFDLRMLVENDSDLALDGLRVVIEIHPPALTRGLLRQALEGDLASEPLTVRTSPELLDGAPLGAGAIAGVAERFEAGDIQWPEGPGGVHPVRIAVTRGTTTLDEVVTAVVWLGEIPTSPLLTSLVWPLDTAPWRTTGGAYPDTVGREVRPGGRLDVLLAAAEEAGAAPLVLAPAAHLLEDLSDRSDGFDALARQDDGSLETRSVTAEDAQAVLARKTLRRIRELAANQLHAPVSGTYADADLAALTDGSTATLELGGIAASEGRRRVQLQLGTPVDAGVHLVDGPISPAVLDLLPGDAVLLPYRATAGEALAGDPAIEDPVRMLRTPSGRLLTALIADPYIEASFAATGHRGGPILTAQRTVAESALAYLVAPGTDDRALVLLPPPTWQPSPTAAAALVRGLGEASWLTLTSPARIASDARYAGSAVELAVSEDGVFQGELVTVLSDASAGLASLASALPDPDNRIQGRSLQDLEDDLMRATSRWYRGDAVTGEAEALVRDVQRAIDTTLGDVEVTSGTVTLTSDSGQIPVTLQRTRGGAVQVVVTVESQGRLLWPEGRRSEILQLDEGSSQTVAFPTQALSTGTFPVTVRITDPEGITILAATTLSVRSTAISGVALTGTGLLIVVLLLVGAFRRRERTAPTLTSVDGP